MKHRHLVDGAGFALPAIDDILDRGAAADWVELARAVLADPTGSIADDVLRICAAHRMYGTSDLWMEFVALARAEAGVRRV